MSNEFKKEGRLHAVTISQEGVAATMSFRTQRELNKALQTTPSLKVLAVFRGKKLIMQEKVSINFC